MKTSILKKFLSDCFAEDSCAAIVKRVDIFGCGKKIDSSVCLVAFLTKSDDGSSYTCLDIVQVYSDGHFHIRKRLSPKITYDNCLFLFKTIVFDLL